MPTSGIPHVTGISNYRMSTKTLQIGNLLTEINIHLTTKTQAPKVVDLVRIQPTVTPVPLDQDTIPHQIRKTRERGSTDKYPQNSTRPKHVQFGTPAPPNVRGKVEKNSTGPAASKPELRHPKQSNLFLAIITTSKNRPRLLDEATFSLSETLEFPTYSTYIALAKKPLYKVRTNYGIIVTATHTTNYLLDIGAVLKFIRLATIPPSWTRRTKRSSVPQLRAGTKQPLILDGLILLHLCLSKMSICI